MENNLVSFGIVVMMNHVVLRKIYLILKVIAYLTYLLSFAKEHMSQQLFVNEFWLSFVQQLFLFYLIIIITGALSFSEDTEGLKSLSCSSLPSRSRLNEKLDILQRAEEKYYQNRGPQGQVLFTLFVVSHVVPILVNITYQMGEQFEPFSISSFWVLYC